ncbi:MULTISPECIES: substrate-binding periplasmic protein [unclassified Maridesulfovibrio]|uniref:substrate-binding periplasmic protein n=1 Tax=unclassified Maridesulfovibrio TaxID=2794999 RepID=UPI003B41A511
MKHIIVTFLIACCLNSTYAFADEDTIRISTSYKTLLSTPEGTGMLDQVIKEAFRRIGKKARIVFTPNERSLIAVNGGMFDGEINRVAGMEKDFPNLIQVPEANMIMLFVAFATKDIIISDWESLRPLRIGIVKGWKILERNTEGFPRITRVMNADQLFLMLHKERIDVALYSKILGHEWIKELNCTHVHHLEPPLASQAMYLYLHKKHEDLVTPLAKAIKEMKKDGTYDKIVLETTGFLYQ